MALDLWFRDDVRRILSMAAQGAARHPADDWRDGYMAAIADLAIAFGLATPAGTSSALTSWPMAANDSILADSLR